MDTMLNQLHYESYKRGQCFTVYPNEVFIYLEKVIEQTESKTITLLEPPLGGRGQTTGNEIHSIDVYKDWGKARKGV